MSTSASYYFISYSRDDAAKQRNVVRELRERGVSVWVDIENLIPGSPAWEREIERSIRAAAGVIVLLSPDSNNSEWVRRELSFAEQNRKKIFPVLISGDEDDSVPLRLSSHQRVDLRRNYNKGVEELADALKDHLGITAVSESIKSGKKNPIKITRADLKKLALPGLLAVIGLACVGGLFFLGSFIIDAIPTQTAGTPIDTDPSITLTANVPNTEPAGRIVYTCNVKGSEVCIINADGTDWRQLTDTQFASFNASLSMDGKRAVFVTSLTSDGKKSEIFELDLDTGKPKQLTDLKNSVGSPEISPDTESIVFHYRIGNKNTQLWIMKSDGSDPQEFYSSSGKDAHDPTWSPDGTQILFALGRGDNNKLYIVDFNGRDPKLVNDSIDTRGRSDWSINDLISFDQGDPFFHDVYLMNVDGSNLRKVTQGNNSQGASISPDGGWIAFTAYTADSRQNSESCEIFIMRVDGTNKRQLTDNVYCDYQPRWGN